MTTDPIIKCTLGATVTAGSDAMQRAERVVALHDGPSKVRSMIIMPTFATWPEESPTGYCLHTEIDAPVCVDCLHGTLCEQLVAVELDDRIEANRTAADALRGREAAVRCRFCPDHARGPDLDCRDGCVKRDARCWDAELGKRGFAGVYETAGTAGTPPRRLMLVYVPDAPAGKTMYKRILDESWGPGLSMGKLRRLPEYGATRTLARRNALRLLKLAADGYGLKIASASDKEAAPRITEPATPDIGALRRGLSNEGVPKVAVKPTYRFEISGLSDGPDGAVVYNDTVASPMPVSDTDAGGLVYVSDPAETVYALRFAPGDGAVMPHAWPVYRLATNATDAGVSGRFAPYDASSDGPALAQLCSQWPQAAQYKCLSVVTV